MRLVSKDELRPSVRSWPGPDGPWRLVLHWTALASGGIECQGVELRAARDDAGPVTATLWRQVRIREEVDAARLERYRELGGGLLEALEQGLLPDGGELSPFLEDVLRDQSSEWSTARPLGRPVALGEDFYRKVASVYREVQIAGRGNPRMVIAEAFHVSSATASRYVREARDRGLLAEYQGTTRTVKSSEVVEKGKS